MKSVSLETVIFGKVSQGGMRSYILGLGTVAMGEA
jgi:hypothetical protein